MMDYFVQSEKAQAFFLRGLTPEEEKEKKEKMDKENPGMYDTPLGSLCGCLTLSDEVRATIPDGRYNCYTNCNHCDSWIDAEAVIKDGIFVGIEIQSTKQSEARKLWDKIDGLKLFGMSYRTFKNMDKFERDELKSRNKEFAKYIEEITR
jgi:hypothetical protein